MYNIYCYTSQTTGMKYIGTTSWTLTKRAGKNGERYNNGGVFWDAIQQYGWSDFTPEILGTADTESEAFEIEKHCISELNTLWPNGYNLQSGGEKGRKMHSHTREAMSNSQSRFKHKGSAGYHWYHNDTEDICATECPEGYIPGRLPRSQETKDKISKAGIGREPWNKGKTLPTRTVYQYTISGELVAKYISCRDAREQTGIRPSPLSDKPNGGYYWSYVEMN